METFGTSYLWVSSPFALLGIGRFVMLVRRKDDADSPTDAMLRDIPFLATLVCWAVCIVALLYFG